MTLNTLSTPTASTENLLNLPSFPELRREDDPFVELIYGDRSPNECPMVKLDFHVIIQGGLAFTKVTRTYINKTAGPIEAIMTIPVSVYASFFGLTALIDGKQYHAETQPKQEALATYEEAIDEGQTAVLHAEILRGIHSLSVGNLGSQKTVIVTSRSVELLRFHEGTGQLRIPLTVGDVYGVSPSEEVDTLTTGGPIPEATLHIEHDAQNIELAGGNLGTSEKGILSSKIPANAPIELRLTGLGASQLTGTAKDGRQVSLHISPHDQSWEPLDVAILVDRSGSMGAHCRTETGILSESQHQAIVRGLRELQPVLLDHDQLALWEFDTDCERVGEHTYNHHGNFRKLVSRLGDPRGGTSIGYSLEKVTEAEEGKDILLITDGQSYSLDVEHFVRAGHRIFVVLIGDGSLEALVGHLAILTGGDIHFSFGADAGRAIQSCIQGMRQQRDLESVVDFSESGIPQRIVTTRNNATVEALWSDQQDTSKDEDEFSEAVAAFAAGMAFMKAKKEWSTQIAVEAGLVTHLTSLVLVAKDAEIQEDLPKTIKQSLPTPRGLTMGIAHSGSVCYSQPVESRQVFANQAPESRHYRDSQRMYSPLLGSMDVPSSPLSSWRSSNVIDLETIKQFGLRIDWNSMGPHLVHFQLEKIPTEIAKNILDLIDDVADFADHLGIPHGQCLIALAAYLVQDSSKHAARVYRRIIKKYDQEDFEKLVSNFEALS
ncbi:MAG: VIT domain-containing protein [Bacteroidetes bacterium]|nr:VIT domain-containing protein [Bacteroidota bacterium]